jgi:hypothetical protein
MRRNTCGRRLGVVLTGSLWEDVGHGECARCKAHRNLYRPLVHPSLRVCAPCTQVFALSSLSNAEPREVEKDRLASEVNDEILN